VDHRNAEVRQVTGFAASGDDVPRFLRDLRQLRDGAGLGQAELAARAHYPYDSIRSAEVGPALPDLPVLAAYVKGCGGTTEEWEERWRSLTSSPSLPVAEARNAGRSPAATAGARIGSTAQEGESPDPAVILAALSRVAEEMASGPDSVPAPADVRPWASVPGGVSTAGAGTDEPEPGARAAGWDPIRVSSAWPAIPASPGDTERTAGARPVANGRAAEMLTERELAPPSAGREPAAPWPAPAPVPAGSAAPWEAAPWAPSSPGAGAFGTGAGRRDPGGLAAGLVLPDRNGPDRAGPDSTEDLAGGMASSPGASAGARRARLLVVSAVLVCVIAVALAIFV
jgi:hypothetical protein